MEAKNSLRYGTESVSCRTKSHVTYKHLAEISPLSYQYKPASPRYGNSVPLFYSFMILECVL